MDADERIVALKKAFAEVLLNTSKEAAARVMAAERKAVRYQHELASAKEAAVHVMMRLKNMIDSKVRDEETTSHSQQGKIEQLEAELRQAKYIITQSGMSLRNKQGEIEELKAKLNEAKNKISQAEMASRCQQANVEELEAQLNEAEDIVKDLREELRYVQAKVEKDAYNERSIATIQEASEEKRLHASQFTVYPPPSQHKSLAASNLMTLDLSQRVEHQKGYDALVHLRNTYSAKADLPSIISRSKEHEPYRNECTQGYRACERNLLNGKLSLPINPNDVNYEKKIEGGRGDESISPAPTDEVNEMCNIEKREVSQKDSRHSSCYQVEANDSFHRKRNRTTKYRKSRSPSYNQHCDQSMDQTLEISCSKTRRAEENPKNKAPSLSPDITAMNIQTDCAKTSESNGKHVKELDVASKPDKTEASIDLVPMGQKGGSAESFVAQVSRINLLKVDEPIVRSESMESDRTDVIPSQSEGFRFFKYTFQRKRKREPLSSTNRSISVGNSTLKGETEQKHDNSAEAVKFCSVKKSSEDKRRYRKFLRSLLEESDDYQSRCSLKISDKSSNVDQKPNQPPSAL